MLGSMFLGLGGSEYVALEIAIALAKKDYETFLSGFFNHKVVDKEHLQRFYGIPLEDLDLINLEERVEGRGLVINASGDVLSGYGDIIYFHYPVFSSVEKYYPEIDGFRKIFANMYHIINKSFMKPIISRAKLLLANSVFTANHIYEATGIKPLIINPPVNTVCKDYPLPINDREKYILIVSRISYEKQPFKIIYVAKALEELGLRDWRIVFAGSVSKYSYKIVENIMELASKHNLDKYIEFKTSIPRNELIDLYRRSFAYIHLTEREHFGITIVEAMSCGTPVIVPYNSGSYIDILAGSTKYGLPYRNYHDLKHALKKLLTDPDHWRILSINSRERSKYFSRENFHEKIVRCVEHIIPKRN